MTDELTAQVSVVTPTMLRGWPLPEPGDAQSSGTKHDRGHVVVVGGARATPGAILLCGLGALRAGAGVLAMAVPECVAVALAVAVPESSVLGWQEIDGGGVGPRDEAALRTLIAGADAVVVGPGIDDPAVAEQVVELVAGAADERTPVLLDAYAIGTLAGRADLAEQLAGRMLLTPNGGEAALLLTGSGDLVPSDAARQMAHRWHAAVSFSGAVAGSDGALYEVQSGHAGLGTSGSGDVLAGVIGGLLARGAQPAQAACWGTYLHAAAGDRLAARIGRLGFLARELLDEVPMVLTELNV